jgi:hypothetical protein
MLGFLAGLALGRNCSKLALKGSEVLRQLADRLDRLVPERERVHPGTVAGEKPVTLKPAA